MGFYYVIRHVPEALSPSRRTCRESGKKTTESLKVGSQFTVIHLCMHITYSKFLQDGYMNPDKLFHVCLFSLLYVGDHAVAHG